MGSTSIILQQDNDTAHCLGTKQSTAILSDVGAAWLSDTYIKKCSSIKFNLCEVITRHGGKTVNGSQDYEWRTNSYFNYVSARLNIQPYFFTQNPSMYF